MIGLSSLITNNYNPRNSYIHFVIFKIKSLLLTCSGALLGKCKRVSYIILLYVCERANKINEKKLQFFNVLYIAINCSKFEKKSW